MQFVARIALLANRRKHLPLTAVCRSHVVLACLLASGATYAAETYTFQAEQAEGDHRAVKVVVDVEGELKVNSDGAEVKRLPLKAHADLQYVERRLSPALGSASLRVARSYHRAEAAITLRKTELKHELRDDRRLVIGQSEESQSVLFSPLGPLTREELELVDVPGSGLDLADLFPEQALAVGDTWKHPDWVIARLLGLEAVNQQDITCKLQDVKDEIAIISMEGKIAGAVGGVSSELELKSKINFDFRKNQVTWLAMAFKESRAVGHAQPGFDVVTQIRMLIAPSPPDDQVSDKALADLTLKADRGVTLVDFRSDSAGYGLVHDRRWRVMVDRHDLTVLRLVDRGDLVAQCNLSRRPALAKGAQLTLEGFQEDIKRALGKNFGQIVEAAQSTNDTDLRVLRVTVNGIASELPIQWTYYHISDANGNRASLVFTIEGDLVERFAQIDRELVTGFQFFAQKEPTPAAPAGTSALKGSAAGPTRK